MICWTECFIVIHFLFLCICSSLFAESPTKPRCSPSSKQTWAASSLALWSTRSSPPAWLSSTATWPRLLNPWKTFDRSTFSHEARQLVRPRVHSKLNSDQHTEITVPVIYIDPVHILCKMYIPVFLCYYRSNLVNQQSVTLFESSLHMEKCQVWVRAFIWQNMHKIWSLYILYICRIHLSTESFFYPDISSSTVIEHFRACGKHACCMDLIHTIYWSKTRFGVLPCYLIVVCVLEMS